MIHRNNNLLLRIAQADAYASASEYVDYASFEGKRTLIESLSMQKYLRHPTRTSYVPGTYSDDTQMSIAVAETILKYDSPSQLQFADAFVQCFKRDKRDAYARGTQWLLESVPDGLTYMSNICSDSDKNGAAMRSVPLGVIRDTKKMLRIASEQASITHNTPAGITSSMIVALMSHYSLYESTPLSELRDYLMYHIEIFPYEEAEGFVTQRFSARVKGTNVGMKTVAAAITLVTEEGTLVDMLKKTIELGGDTDTVGSIVWGVASARFLDETLPPFFESMLETGSTYGVKFLKELSNSLMDMS